MIRAFCEKLLRLLFHNLGYKMLSILLALIVWAIIQGEQVQEVSTEVHVTIHVAPGYGVRGELRRVKAATIRGPQAWLLEVPQKLAADVFIPPGKLGRYRIRLSKDDVKNLNERLELVIHEPYLDLFVDRLNERILQVKETIHGSPAEGFVVEKVIIEPKTVNVKAIRNDLLKLRYVYTEPIDVSSLKESRRMEVKLVSAGLGSDALGAEKVEVFIVLGDSKSNKRFTNIPIQIIGAKAAAMIKPQSVSITVQAAPAVLETLKKTDFTATIEVQDLKPGRHEQEIKITLPPHTQLIETLPEKAIVTLGKG